MYLASVITTLAQKVSNLYTFSNRIVRQHLIELTILGWDYPRAIHKVDYVLVLTK